MKASALWLDFVYDFGLFGGSALLAFLPALLIQRVFDLTQAHLFAIWGLMVLGLLLFFIPYISIKIARSSYRWFKSGQYKRDLKQAKSQIPVLKAELKDILSKS